MTATTLTPEQAGRIYRCMARCTNLYCRYFDEWTMVSFAYHDDEMRDAMRPFGIDLPDPDPEHPRKWPSRKIEALEKRAAIWLSDTAGQVFDGLILTQDNRGWCYISAVGGGPRDSDGKHSFISVPRKERRARRRKLRDVNRRMSVRSAEFGG